MSERTPPTAAQVAEWKRMATTILAKGEGGVEAEDQRRILALINATYEPARSAALPDTPPTVETLDEAIDVVYAARASAGWCPQWDDKRRFVDDLAALGWKIERAALPDTPSAAPLDFTNDHVIEWAHTQIELELTSFLNDEEWDTAEIAARMIGRLQGLIGGPVPSFARVVGSSAASETTDALRSGGSIRLTPQGDAAVTSLDPRPPTDDERVTPEFRQALLSAASRALKWRRHQIMAARLTWVFCLQTLGMWDDRRWHSLFECDRHGHHPLRADWVGPFDFEDTDVHWPHDVC